MADVDFRIHGEKGGPFRIGQDTPHPESTVKLTQWAGVQVSLP